MKRFLLTIFGVASMMVYSCTESGIENDAMNGSKIKLSATQVEVGFEGETEFKVTVNSPCSWEAESKNDWLNVVTKQGVAGTKELLFYAGDNYDLKKREGTIVVTNRDYGYIDELYVTQKGFEPRIEYPESITFNSEGGNFNVTIAANFSWSYTDDASWLSCSKTSNGLKVTATEWTSTKERTAEITLYSSNNQYEYNIEKIIKVTQKQFEPTLSIDTTELNFGVNGGSQYIYVTTNASEYSVSESSSWLSCTQSSNKVTVKATASDVTSERTAEIKIYLPNYNLSQTIKVTQKKFVPEFEVKVSEVEFEAESSSKTISVTANFDYSVSESVSWLSYQITSSGVKLTATANVDEKERTADVKIYNNTYDKSATVKVKQKKFVPEFEVSVSELAFGTEGGTQTIPVTANFDYNVSENADWLSYQITSSGVELTATANVEEKDRTADITIHNNTYGKSATIKVIQAAIIANCAIYYTSSDGDIITPNKASDFGAKILTNIYYNGMGIILFDAPVTSIGKNAFINSRITSITIPNSVTSIGYYAFSGCSSLTSVHISDLSAWCKIKFGSNDANPLYYAENLYLNGNLVTELTIPLDITKIEEYAFDGCSSLTSITIPNSVTSIGSDAFYGCSSLASIIIPDSVTSIGSSAFSSCSSLTSITIPNSVTEIGGSAFNSCTGELIIESKSLVEKYYTDNSYPAYNRGGWLYGNKFTKLTIGDNITSIGNYAFYNCSSLTSVTIGNGVTSIGKWAFSDCSSLTSITIPNSVTSIGSSAFSSCSSLTSITIPNSVTSIGSQAFYLCSSLVSITIPNSVTSIERSAFNGCSSLTSITLLDSVTSIGDSAFYNCSSLTSVTIPDSVTSIGDSAFYNCSSLPIIDNIRYADTYAVVVIDKTLSSYTIKDSTRFIGNYAFDGCSSLTSVTIPDSVTSIGRDAFSNCSSLTSVHISDLSAWCKIKFGNNGANPLYYAKNLCLNGKLATELTIPSDITSIGKYAFYNCSSLTSITLPDSVTSIGDSAFYNCSRLTSVTIPNSVTEIGWYAFYNCSRLTSVTIPNSVTEIGWYAFHGCSSLTSVYCKPTTPPAGGSEMFDDNASGRKIYVPRNSVYAYKSASGWSGYASSIIGYDFE